MRMSEGTPPERTLNDGATFPRQLTYTTRTLRIRSREKSQPNLADAFYHLLVWEGEDPHIT